MRWSAGCEHCYAESLNKRFGGPGYTTGADTPRLDERILEQPLRWRLPRKVFVGSMTDLFEQRIPDEWIARVWAVMAMASGHTFQVLTKRPERMCLLLGSSTFQALVTRALHEHRHPKGWYLEGVGAWPLTNVWCGTSIEQDRWTGRADVLLQTPAAVRFLSLEPLLEPLPSLRLGGLDHLDREYRSQIGKGMFNSDQVDSLRRPVIDWVIVGGESGHAPDSRSLVEACDHTFGVVFVNGVQQISIAPPKDCLICYGTGWRPKPWAEKEAKRLRLLTHLADGAFFFKQWGGPRSHSGGRMLVGREWLEFPKGTL